VSEHRIPRAYVLTLRVFGILGLAVGGAMVLAALYADWSGERASVPMLVGGTGALLAAASWWMWRTARAAPSRAVAADASGLRSLDPEQPHLALTWSDVQGVVPRFLAGRLDVLRPYGEPLRLEYQLERFDELLAVLMEHARQVGRARSRPVRFGGRLSRVEITDQELVLGRRRRFPLAEVRRPFLHLWKDGRGNAALQLWVALEGSRAFALGVRPSELFDAYRTLEAALAGQRA
jgi:hypothetical protein